MIYLCEVQNLFLCSSVFFKLLAPTRIRLDCIYSHRLYFHAFKNNLCEKKLCIDKAYNKFTLIKDLKQNKISEALSNFGFNSHQIKSILTSQSEILDLKEKDITSNLIYWLNFKLEDKYLIRVLVKVPELLLLNPKFIESRSVELLKVFTQKDITKLLKTCPRVFLDDWEIIMDKMQYLIHHMGLEQKTIVKYGALHFDLNHIKIRHLLLYYCGIYETPKRRKLVVNPSLDLILQENLKNYLKLSGLCKEEYNAFCKIFKKLEQEQISDTEAHENDIDSDESDLDSNESDSDIEDGDSDANESDLDPEESDVDTGKK